jgi:hypothetical protein
MVLGPDGHLYVTDATAGTVKRVSLTGLVTTVAGSPNNPGTADGTGTASQFQEPETLCFTGDGTLVVADASCLRRITPSGQVVTWVGDPNTRGYRDGNGTHALFQCDEFTTQMAVDAAGNVIYPDWRNNAVRVISPAGDVRSLCRNGINSTVYTLQTTCGPSTVFGNHPWSVYIDVAGNQYYTYSNDYYGEGRRVGFNLYKIRDPVSLQVQDVPGRWRYPCSVLVDAIGTHYVFDCPKQAGQIFVRQSKSGRVLSLVGGQDGFADGQGSNALFGAYGSNAMVFDGAGHLYVMLHNYLCSSVSGSRFRDFCCTQVNHPLSYIDNTCIAGLVLCACADIVPIPSMATFAKCIRRPNLLPRTTRAIAALAHTPQPLAPLNRVSHVRVVIFVSKVRV